MIKESIVFYRLMALSVGTFLFSAIAVWILQLSGLMESIPLHTALETFGSIIAFFFSFFIFKFDNNNNYYLSRFHIVSLSLIAFAVIGLFHAISIPGSMFVWLYTAGMFVGSILMLGVFIPERRVSPFLYTVLPLISVVIASGIASVLLYKSDILPAAIVNGNFSSSDILVSNLSALFFFLSSIPFAYHYRQKHQYEDIYFFALAMLLSASSFLFQYSMLWEPTWWYWHFIRLSGFFFLLLYFIRFIEEKNQLFISRELQSSVIDFSADAIITKSLDGVIQSWNIAAENLFGYTAEEAIGKSTAIFYSPPAASKESENIRHISEGASLKRFETVFIAKNGTYIDVTVTLSPIKDSNNRVVGISKIVHDITEQKKARDAFRKLFIQNEAILDSVPDIIMQVDMDKRYTWANKNGIAFFGEDVIGQEASYYFKGEQDTYETTSSLFDGDQNIIYVESFQKRCDGETRLLAWWCRTLRDENGNPTGVLSTAQDITEQKHTEERMHYLANYDPLTGLPNRAQFIEHISYFINVAKHQKGEFAIMFLDLDHFKDINDLLGHSIGDILLVDLAKRIQECIREEDTVSRLGGDEFIFMLPNITTQGVVNIAEKLLEEITKPFLIEENELIVTASIGITMYPIDGIEHDTLLKNADTAMYQAKLNGRNNFRFFTKTMQESLTRNIQLTNALRHALEKDQLDVVYQPQVAISDTHIIGAEALLRWNHPEFGAVSPAEFIPLAEESGLILPIGEWVLRRAVKQAKEWIDSGFPPIIVAVNLSAVQFRHPHLPELVTTILDEIGLPPEYLELELTEAVAMHDPKSAYAIMDNLHERGVRMSIDDFGTGYSSLSYLKKFKVYKLKIDQSFIRDISIDSEDKAIVNAIISMAHSLGLQVIAEGVETIEQLTYLREEGCDEIQGYYFSKPLTSESFNTFIATQVKK